MDKITSWIKSHKLATVLILFLAYLLLKPRSVLLNANISGSPTRYQKGADLMVSESVGSRPGIPTPIPDSQAPPQPDVEDRKKVRNATISLHVENVRKTIEAINTYVDKSGGYVVNQDIRTPEESSSGSMTVRVPTERLDETLDYLRDRSVNVVYESVSGRDITDEYVDTQAKLETLQKTKSIFEGMLDEAETFDEILRAQKEVLNIQKQIDNVKGQIAYMEGTSETALIRINLSTDALELGYAPANAWRPKVVAKRAIRSLITNLRSFGNLMIWLAVYGIVWVPVLIIVLLVVRKKKKGKNKSKKK